MSKASKKTVCNTVVYRWCAAHQVVEKGRCKRPPHPETEKCAGMDVHTKEDHA